MTTLATFVRLPMRVRSRNRSSKPVIKQNNAVDKDKSINVAERKGLSNAVAATKQVKKMANPAKAYRCKPLSKRSRLVSLLIWRTSELFVGILLFLCIYFGFTALIAFLGSQFMGFAFGYITVIWLTAWTFQMRAFLEAMHD